MPVVLYGFTPWMLTKCIEKKLEGNRIRVLRAILNNSWKQHPTKQQCYGHRPPISKTIQIRWRKHMGHCLKSKDELISDIIWWTPSHGRASVAWPTKKVGCPRGVMAKVINCGIVVSEFILQSCYYVHFRANIFGKGMNPLILPAMG